MTSVPRAAARPADPHFPFPQPLATLRLEFSFQGIGS